MTRNLRRIILISALTVLPTVSLAEAPSDLYVKFQKVTADFSKLTQDCQLTAQQRLRQDKLNSVDVGGWKKERLESAVEPVVWAYAFYEKSRQTAPKTASEKAIAAKIIPTIQRFQSKCLVTMRWLFGQGVHEMLWHAEGKAYTTGDNEEILNLVDMSFMSNSKITKAYNALEKTVRMMRFKEIRFKTHEFSRVDNDKYVSVKLPDIADSELLTEKEVLAR